MRGEVSWDEGERKLMSNHSNIHLALRRQHTHQVQISTMNLSLLFFFLLFSIHVNCFGLRVTRNHAFSGVISQTIYDVDWLGCLEACSRSEKCVSYNYKCLLDAQDEVGVCELIADSGECDTGSLVYLTGFIFHQIRENNKVKIEC